MIHKIDCDKTYNYIEYSEYLKNPRVKDIPNNTHINNQFLFDVKLFKNANKKMFE